MVASPAIVGRSVVLCATAQPLRKTIFQEVHVTRHWGERGGGRDGDVEPRETKTVYSAIHRQSAEN